MVEATNNDGEEVIVIPSSVHVPTGEYWLYVEGCRGCPDAYKNPPYTGSWDYRDQTFRIL